MVTMTRHHNWVKHTVTNVSILPDPDNDKQVVSIEDPTEVQAAEDQAVYGCSVCSVALEGNSDTLCKGPDHE